MKKSRCYNAQRLAEYCSGLGSRRWRQKVAGHLTSCDRCRREVEALKKTERLLDSLTLKAAPDLWDNIKPQLIPQSRPTPWRVPVFAAVGVAVVLFLAVLMFPSANINPPSDRDAYRYDQYDSHATMIWNDPFVDRASLAVYTTAGEDW